MALRGRRLAESAYFDSVTAAFELKKLLNENKLNVVTAESLTAGMLCKTLVDIPGEGATVYGCFGVYDTDAKRKFIDVSTEGVYSQKTAHQMAMGALKNSRAMVAIAVTGDAMPYPSAKHRLGVVYVGVALRTQGSPRVFTDELRVCDDAEVENVCDAWKELTVDQPKKFAPYQITAMIADYIRMRTVELACKFAIDVIEGISRTTDIKWGKIPSAYWDRACKPSPVVSARVDSEFTDKYCNDEAEADISLVPPMAESSIWSAAGGGQRKKKTKRGGRR